MPGQQAPHWAARQVLPSAQAWPAWQPGWQLFAPLQPKWSTDSQTYPAPHSESEAQLGLGAQVPAQHAQSTCMQASPWAQSVSTKQPAMQCLGPKQAALSLQISPFWQSALLVQAGGRGTQLPASHSQLAQGGAGAHCSSGRQSVSFRQPATQCGSQVW